MSEWPGLGKLLIVGGAVLIVLGILVLLSGKLFGWANGGGDFGWFGKLPGDIYIKRENFTFYAPLASGLLVSFVLSLILYLISFLWKR